MEKQYTARELLEMKARRLAKQQEQIAEAIKSIEAEAEVKKGKKKKGNKGQDKVTPNRTMMTVDEGEEIYINPEAEVKFDVEESVED